MSKYVPNELYDINHLKLMESDILTAPQVDVFYSAGRYEWRLPELKFSCLYDLTLLRSKNFYAAESQYILQALQFLSCLLRLLSDIRVKHNEILHDVETYPV